MNYEKVTATVTVRNGSFYVAETRVSLASIVYEYRSGSSVEVIQGNFPVLSRDHVNGAIAFYLTHQQEVDADLARREQRWKQLEDAAIAESE